MANRLRCDFQFILLDQDIKLTSIRKDTTLTLEPFQRILIFLTESKVIRHIFLQIKNAVSRTFKGRNIQETILEMFCKQYILNDRKKGIHRCQISKVRWLIRFETVNGENPLSNHFHHRTVQCENSPSEETYHGLMRSPFT